MIFPGMDPYLEHPALWPGVHSRMVIYIADALQPAIGPRYIAAVEERVYIEKPPHEIIPDVSVRTTPGFERSPGRGGAAVLEMDAPMVVKAEPLEVTESFVQLLDLHSGQRIVTVIELLSPANKRPGPGRDSYLRKQGETLDSQAHLIEIDLLRGGTHTLAVPEANARRTAGNYDYAVSVHRAGATPGLQFELYPVALRHRLPRLRVPLAEGDADVPLDLQAVLAQTYVAGSYRRRLDYTRPVVPGLRPEDEAWVRERVAAAA